MIPVFAAAHLDSNVYESPNKFDPWRWQVGSMLISSNINMLDLFDMCLQMNRYLNE